MFGDGVGHLGSGNAGVRVGLGNVWVGVRIEDAAVSRSMVVLDAAAPVEVVGSG